jgi:formylglycine-generating enzyme required for sulfatase activity
MVLVEGGTFPMGSADGERRETPVHTVTVSGFYMGKYEVTQKEWREIMGSNPGAFKGDDRPVEQVSWYEAVEYCNRRSVQEGLTPAYRGSGDGITCDFTASGYRLPTEAEWEYAAKGGRDAPGAEYAGGNDADAVAWYGDNSKKQTHSVGTKEPNSLGLYDMSGNVWEWCWDWFGSYGSGSQTDPRGASPLSTRVNRGGSWTSTARSLRSACRSGYPPSGRDAGLGFRLARSVPEPARTALPAGMVLVEGGTFPMGSADGERSEKPVHTVTVGSFYMGKYEVTQKEWTEIMGTTIGQQWTAAGNSGTPTRGAGDNYPVYCVSWYEAVEYCNRRSVQEGLTPAYRGSGDGVTCDFAASGYRLPTEAEWEYAARGGRDAPEAEYAGGNDADAAAWYLDNSGGQTHPVGTKEPNGLGLYDMSGNVYEWCWDWFGSYGSGPQTDPKGPPGPASPGAARVYRGGCWFNLARAVRSALRRSDAPSYRYDILGFRLVRSVPGLRGPSV